MERRESGWGREEWGRKRSASATREARQEAYAARGALEGLAGGERLGGVAEGGSAGDEGGSSETSLGEVATEHLGWGKGGRGPDEGMRVSALCLRGLEVLEADSRSWRQRGRRESDGGQLPRDVRD